MEIFYPVHVDFLGDESEFESKTVVHPSSVVEMQNNAWESIVEKTCYIPGGSSVLFHTITAGFMSTETSA